MKEIIKAFFRGDIADDQETLLKYSHDASLLEVKPTLVLYPKDSYDVQQLVKFVNDNKSAHPELSITGRSAGTDMSGGPLNESLILDFTRYFKREDVDIENLKAIVEPGVFYHDFETVTLPKHISLPVYPASKDLAALGGMVMNNSAGEKTLRYGQIRDFVEEISMVLADGKEYSFKKLSRSELEAKMSQGDFEGDLYKKTYALISKNDEVIRAATPTTSKNSSGYALWRVWDKAKDTFDLSQLFVGSQGTLGILTRAKIRLVKDTPDRKLITVFFKSWDDLPAVVNATLPYGPESMETFDDTTLKLGMRFMPEIARKVHLGLFKFALGFLPEFFIGLRMLGLPKLIVLIELAENDQQTVNKKTVEIMQALKKFPVYARVLEEGQDSDKYWVMRRESFNLLRQHVHGKRTAPFIDDFIIDPAKMPEFLPKLLKILKDNGITANIAGHAGNGNYHIIPLMDFKKESERAKIVPVSEKVYDLIIQYGGSITAEHNDGIIRTPFVEKMFGPEMYQLFVGIKHIFDPLNIFNPGKKVGGTIKYLQDHLIK
ncbi:MAG: FAD-binding oxidoreductase [Candidatus Pacebacteria bacterium]|nr:FAD-binding oxidoreductase [Candidatus Paceibacterota bacterium]